MSPCYRQSSVAIHFTWKQDWTAVRRLLPLIEKELSSYQVRPHWGKLFTLAPSELRARYPKLPDFIHLATKFDPKGKFRNDFLDSQRFRELIPLQVGTMPTTRSWLEQRP